MNNRKLFTLSSLAVVLFTSSAFAWWPFDKKDKDAKSPDSSTSIKVDEASVERRTTVITSFAPIVKKIAPSVVSISTTKKIKVTEQRNPLFEDPFFRRFFGDQFGGGPEGGPDHQPRQRNVQGLGSGVIISSDGYIVTNNHVVEGMDEIVVGVPTDKGSARELKAKVIGTDPKTDIAVLKVDSKDLIPATLGDSDKIEVGDIVLAIGNPFGLSQTVTQGIVSALSRGVGIIQKGIEDFIQTDAAINPGNSGGALVDMDGRLIGINTAIVSRSGGNQGIGFAVPINLVRNVMEQIITKGKVIRGFMGVQIQPLNPELVEQLKLKDNVGALISDVVPGSPADQAGLKPGDVVTEVDGKTITDPRHLQLQISQTPPGTKVQIKVLRDGKPKAVTAQLREMPADNATSSDDDNDSKDDNKDSKAAAPKRSLAGLDIGNIDNQSREQAKIPEKVKGALVRQVDPDSEAFEQGVRPGDVIIEIEGKSISNAKEAYEILSSVKNKQKVVTRIWRNGARFVVLSIKDNK